MTRPVAARGLTAAHRSCASLSLLIVKPRVGDDVPFRCGHRHVARRSPRVPVAVMRRDVPQANPFTAPALESRRPNKRRPSRRAAWAAQRSHASPPLRGKPRAVDVSFRGSRRHDACQSSRAVVSWAGATPLSRPFGRKRCVRTARGFALNVLREMP